MKHIISVLVENHFGVLARVAGLFSARGFNIDSLAVGETEDPTISRMTIVVEGDIKILDQIIKQLNKLIDVLKVKDITADRNVARELVLVKVKCNQKNRAELMQVLSTFRAKVVDVCEGYAIIETTGSEGKEDALLELLSPYGIIEVVRTGLIALGRTAEVVFDGKSQQGALKKSKKKIVKKKVSKKKK